jgi:pimeloyl-ACP methyl ester carboxylesterase
MFRSRWMIWLLLLVAGYLLIVVAMVLFQDRLVFVGARSGRGVAVVPPVGVVVDRLVGEDGGAFRIAIGRPAAPPRAVVVSFVGNGEDLRSGVHWAARWRDYELASVVVEYPGYGDSEGEPGTDSMLAAARVATAHARRLANERGVRLVAVGSSLGSFMATHVAGLGLVDRVLLLAPPTTMVEVASGHYPWLPIRFLLRHRFDSRTAATTIRVPVCIVHGDRDTVVPVSHGRALQQAIGDHAELIVVEGASHNDLPLHPDGPLGATLRAFLHGR